MALESGKDGLTGNGESKDKQLTQNRLDSQISSRVEEVVRPPDTL